MLQSCKVVGFFFPIVVSRGEVPRLSTRMNDSDVFGGEKNCFQRYHWRRGWSVETAGFVFGLRRAITDLPEGLEGPLRLNHQCSKFMGFRGKVLSKTPSARTNVKCFSISAAHRDIEVTTTPKFIVWSPDIDSDME